MAPAYVGLARELEAQGQRPAALAALRKALRLRPVHPDTPKIESRIAYLEALDLIDAGAPDRFLIERAIELDPGNEEARALLGSLEERAVKKQSRTQRYLAAAAIAAVAVIGMAVMALWPRTRKRVQKRATSRTPVPTPTPDPTPADATTEPEAVDVVVPATGDAPADEPPSGPATSAAPTVEPETRRAGAGEEDNHSP
jgi:tetratricopeptide (TPR) repeat protein